MSTPEHLAKQTIEANPDQIPHLSDPMPLLQRLQDEAPVHCSTEEQAWTVTRDKKLRGTTSGVVTK